MLTRDVRAEGSSIAPLIVEDAVALAIRSFLNGSAGGPVGLTPQHLTDMISVSTQKGGPVC